MRSPHADHGQQHRQVLVKGGGLEVLVHEVGAF